MADIGTKALSSSKLLGLLELVNVRIPSKEYGEVVAAKFFREALHCECGSGQEPFSRNGVCSSLDVPTSECRSWEELLAKDGCCKCCRSGGSAKGGDDVDVGVYGRTFVVVVGSFCRCCVVVWLAFEQFPNNSLVVHRVESENETLLSPPLRTESAAASSTDQVHWLPQP